MHEGGEAEPDFTFLSEIGFEDEDLARCTLYVETAVARARGGDTEVFYEDDRGVPMAIFFEVPDPIPFEDEVDYLLAGGRLNIFVSSLDGLDVVMTKLQFLFGIPSSRIQLSAYGLQIAEDYSDWNAHSPLNPLLLKVLPAAVMPPIPAVEEKLEPERWPSVPVMFYFLAQAAFRQGSFELCKSQIKAVERTLGSTPGDLSGVDVEIGYPISSCQHCYVKLHVGRSFSLFTVYRDGKIKQEGILQATVVETINVEDLMAKLKIPPSGPEQKDPPPPPPPASRPSGRVSW